MKNQAWIDKTQKLTQRQMEQEIVKENPKQAVKDSMKYIAEKTVSLKCAISEELMKKIERVKDPESQKEHKPCSLERALEKMAEAYLQKHDPVRKAERTVKPSSRKAAQHSVIETHAPTNGSLLHRKQSNSRAIPAAIRNAVFQRDKGQCQ